MFIKHRRQNKLIIMLMSNKTCPNKHKVFRLKQETSQIRHNQQEHFLCGNHLYLKKCSGFGWSPGRCKLVATTRINSCCCPQNARLCLDRTTKVVLLVFWKFWALDFRAPLHRFVILNFFAQKSYSFEWSQCFYTQLTPGHQGRGGARCFKSVDKKWNYPRRRLFV